MQQEAIKHELNFWKGFIKSENFINNWIPDKRTPELMDDIYEYINRFCLLDENHSVLDVGSGVVSILRGTVPAKQLQAVDPLANEYVKIFNYEKYGISKPLNIAAEKIPFKEAYDIVHISNALDHTQDPKLAFEKLFAAVKPGGSLIIQGFENEANYEKWAGFHQWNLELKDQKIEVRGKTEKYFLEAECLRIVKHIPNRHNGRNWFIWIGQKQ